MLLGGEPFESDILMSWNFVARTAAEMDAAYGDWALALDGGSDRFADVRSPLLPIPAPSRR